MKTFTSTKTMILLQDDQIMIILIGNFPFFAFRQQLTSKKHVFLGMAKLYGLNLLCFLFDLESRLLK